MATVTADSACLALPVSREDHGEPNGERHGEPSDRLSSRDVHEIVEKKLASKDFRLINWSMKPLGETNGFLGLYYYVYVSARVKNRVENFRFFAKTPPSKESPQYDFVTRFDSFNKEITAYTDILPRLDTGSGQRWWVHCYFHRKNDILVLEDASVHGYAMPDKYVVFDYEYCTWMLKALARLHAGSLVLDEKLRRQGSSLFDVYGHLLGEVLFADNDTRSSKALKACTDGGCTMADLAEGLTEDQRVLAKNRIRKWGPKIVAMLEPSKRYRNVICHRDCWFNNFLVKRDSAGKPVGFYLIDFQFLRYCPPAIDFTFCLYLTTDRATRHRYFEAFMRIYYDTVKEVLKDQGLDIEQSLPWEEFCQSCEAAKPTAVLYAIFNLHMMLLSGDAIEQTLYGNSREEILYGNARGELVRQQFQTNEAYKERNSEMILEVIDSLPDDPGFA